VEIAIMIASLSPFQNTLLTIGCLLLLVWLGYLIWRMFKALRRDAHQSEEDRERELRDWNEGE
jgi:threonine/homoserine/homoserine lactone efflux protein